MNNIIERLRAEPRGPLCDEAADTITRLQGEASVMIGLRGADVDPLCQQTAATGLEALRRMWERHKRIGKWGFDGPGLADVELAIDLHEQLVRLSTPLELQQTMSRVIAARDAVELES